MAYTTIDDPTKYFNTSIYTGTLKEDRPIVGTGFQPDLIWFKNRNTTNSHNILDSTRGVTKRLRTDDNSAEATTSTRLKSFDSDGMTISTDPAVNGSGNGIVAWQWKANGGTRTTNSESGNNPGGGYQANTTAGFSIVDWTGTGGAGTMAHGLGAVPHAIFVHDRGGNNHAVYHKSVASDAETDYLRLDTNGAATDESGRWNDTAPTSTVFTIGSNNEVNGDDRTYVAWVFTPIQGYSKFGGYTGNGATDGPFVYTGFKPAWTMIKETGQTGSWYINDNKRDTFNLVDLTVYADLANAEATETNNSMDYLSNGFKLRGAGNDTNLDGGTYVYMAFAEAPFVTSNGAPANAL